MTKDIKQGIRYEYQRWPLWRWDLNWLYIKKSIQHQRAPVTMVDQQHYNAMRSWTQSYLDSHSNQEVVSIAATGDIMWIRQGWDTALSSGVKCILGQAALTLNNMETPIVPGKPIPRLVYETFHYNAPTDYLDNWQTFPQESQHVFSLCNNHALDQGIEGLAATRKAILEKDTRFQCIGGVEPEQHYHIIQLRELKIGVFSASFGINHLKSGQPAPEGIPLQHFGNSNQEPDWEQIKQTIKALKKESDVVIFYPHWGYEYEYWPDQLQRQHALSLIALGIDIIIGHSPHVLQPIDYVSINHYDSTCPLQVVRDGPAKLGIIVWSLGNFLSIMPTLACKTGAILQLSLKHTGTCWSVHQGIPVPVYTCRPEGGTPLQRRVMLLSELPRKHHNKKEHIVAHCQNLFPIIRLC